MTPQRDRSCGIAARPTARRLLLTLEELGYVRSVDGQFALTPKVLGLGTAYVSALGLWEIARPHLDPNWFAEPVNRHRWLSTGLDIVYMARVSVPKIIALRVDIGTRFPAAQTSQGKVLLAALYRGRSARQLAQPSPVRAAAVHREAPAAALDELIEVRARGWALADQELAPVCDRSRPRCGTAQGRCGPR